MPSIHNPALVQWLVSSLILFFLFWAIVAVAVGVGLIVCSSKTLKFFDAMNQYVSTRRGFKSMAVPHDIGQSVRKYRIWIAGILIAGSAYSIFGLLAWFNVGAVVSRFNLNFPQVFVSWIVESLRWLLIIGGACGFMIGVMLGFFPNALDTLEARANKWYSLRNYTRGGDTMHLTLDKWVAAFPRVTGWIIVLSALFVAINAAIVLLGRN